MAQFVLFASGLVMNTDHISVILPRWEEDGKVKDYRVFLAGVKGFDDGFEIDPAAGEHLMRILTETGRMETGMKEVAAKDVD